MQNHICLLGWLGVSEFRMKSQKSQFSSNPPVCIGVQKMRISRICLLKGSDSGKTGTGTCDILEWVAPICARPCCRASTLFKHTFVQNTRLKNTLAKHTLGPICVCGCCWARPKSRSLLSPGLDRQAAQLGRLCNSSLLLLQPPGMWQNRCNRHQHVKSF